MATELNQTVRVPRWYQRRQWKTSQIGTPLASVEIVRRHICRSMPGCEPNTQGREVFLLFIYYLRECIRSKNTFQHG